MHTTDVKSIPLHFPDGLFDGLETIHKSNIGKDNPYGRKYYVLNLALSRFNSLTCSAAQTAYTLSDEDFYKVDSENPTSYFKEAFDVTKINDTYLNSVPSKEDVYYDYDSSKEHTDVMAFWLDFADHKLGGGVFRTGFLQEERMCCETPDLANGAGLRIGVGLGIETRKGGGDVLEVLKGSPTPVAITGVHRVIDTQPNGTTGIKDLRNAPPTSWICIYVYRTLYPA